MDPTAAQLVTLSADIAANTATAPGTTGQIKDLEHTADNAYAVAQWYNQTASPAYIVWRDLPMETVLGLITYANMTPADAVPTTPDLSVQVWIARGLACQGKQFNLQNLTIGRFTAPMKKTSYRAALQDCLTNLPAGANGALIAANWTGVRDAAKSSATNAEKVLATGAGTTGAPSDLGAEGALSDSVIRAIWGI